MEYTIQKLAQMAGVSTRTLRFYDEIGILKPARINSSGYRIYTNDEVDRLQQILFYRQLNVPLEKIKEIITSPDFDALQALKEHRQKLMEMRKQLDQVIATVEKTIKAKEGTVNMSDHEKFEGLKQQRLEENEARYGKEIRQKYGEEAVQKANEKFAKMTQDQFEEAERINKELIETLHKAMESSDPASPLAQRAAELHKQWLMFFWSEYRKEAHAGVVQMYVDDARFTQYYDQHKPGMAKFLRDAVWIYTGHTE